MMSAELGPFWRVVPRSLSGLAGVASLSGDYVRSARLFGAAEALWEASGKRELVDWRAIVDADIANVQARLGAESFAAAWREGHALRIEEALAYAVERPGPAPGARDGPLTAREREVAALIAGGFSNRQIAQALVIAEATAVRHVANILHKLSMSSRAQVAVWATEQGLAEPGRRPSAAV
jgi:non-specific serine/threonine protein kinase